MNKVYIKTFGCAQNTADSERIKAYYREQGWELADNWKVATEVVINSCVIRESAENRVYGLISNVKKFNPKINIILTGCLVGISKKQIRDVDEMWPIEKFEVQEPLRDKKKAALITISNGCNNFCSYCIVPYARGKEVSRPTEEILLEVDGAVTKGFEEIVLIGQNVNSYGADLGNGESVSMGKKRFRSLFPKLLEEVAKKPVEKISFISSNPWDFSDELIKVIAKYPNIDKLLHLPFQSGDDEVLKKMNRGYTKKEYLDLVEKIKQQIEGVQLSTDIIIGFPGEDEEAFQNTVDVCKKVNFEIAYLNKYSPRKGTVSAKLYKDEVPPGEKRRRWKVLNELVNKS